MRDSAKHSTFYGVMNRQMPLSKWYSFSRERIGRPLTVAFSGSWCPKQQLRLKRRNLHDSSIVAATKHGYHIWKRASKWAIYDSIIPIRDTMLLMACTVWRPGKLPSINASMYHLYAHCLIGSEFLFLKWWYRLMIDYLHTWMSVIFLDMCRVGFIHV